MSETPESTATPPPTRQVGQQRGVGFAIVMWIVTLGIYGFYWIYKSFEEVRAYRGQGVGGLAGVLLAFIIVSTFLLPAYVGRMYQEDSKQNPVSGYTGFWVLLPYVGSFIWIWKIQSALNEFWASKGAPAPGAAPATA
jgi:apolipoprotein N-acyltransferase